MAEVKYIKIGKKQYKKWNVILFFCFLIIVYILLTVYMLFNLKSFIGYKPETKQELEELIKNRYIPLSMLDTSRITDMSWLFHGGLLVNFKDIDNWDVSHVKNMTDMFCSVERKHIPSWYDEDKWEEYGTIMKIECKEED